MIDIKSIREKIISGEIDIDCIEESIKRGLDQEYHRLVSTHIFSQEDFENTENLLKILNDVYIYSSSGEVLVSDSEYNMLMNRYIENGGSLISTSDIIKSQTRWEFINHEAPGMVGSISKVYTYDELSLYFEKLNHFSPHFTSRKMIIAPKFDGISSAIKISSDGMIELAVTRNDGLQGQNITKVIRNSKNGKKLAKDISNTVTNGHAWIKTEIVMTTEDFNLLKEEKEYSNRRSATSGIVNTPKNVGLCKYLTIIPLAVYYTSTDEIVYCPPDAVSIRAQGIEDVIDTILKLLSKIRDADYPIRTDGVVIYPEGEDIEPNYNDIMNSAIAFKVNMKESYTTVQYGYVSVGRLGYAVPMLKVHPVEVNETIVEDVSLGSFDKFMNMDIHEDEKIIVYSAGDVIPQAKLPENRKYSLKSKLIKIKKRCPYCNEKLTRYKSTYRCTNENCIRIISGKISNFVIKLGIENVSDRTIETLVNMKIIRSIPDIFYVTRDQISGLKDFGDKSANIIVSEFQRIKNKPIPISDLLGALGIQGISSKKCKNILSQLDTKFKKILRMKNGPEEFQYKLLDLDNVGEKTAGIFTDFLVENRRLILDLLEIMNITNDIKYNGNVVFTGFRNPQLEKRFNNCGYEISNNVNDNTIVVIDVSYDHSSTKCKAARKKGIDVINLSEVEKVFECIE